MGIPLRARIRKNSPHLPFLFSKCRIYIFFSYGVHVFLFLYHFIEVDGTADLIRPFIAILSCSSQPCVMGAMDRMNHHSSQSSDYNASTYGPIK